MRRNRTTNKFFVSFLFIFLLLSLSGCATPGNTDPYEKMNRKIFDFNRVVDKAVYRPIAKTYDTIIPTPIEARITHFFNNVSLLPTIANDALQANVIETFSDLGRLIINTTLGIGGLFDVASHMQLPNHHNDFGITLAKWGVKNPAYLVIPFVGPSTFRDAVGLGGDYFVSVWFYLPDNQLTWSLFALDKINDRAGLLAADKLVDQAFDPYVFMRDAYLQHRNSQIQQSKLGQAQNTDTFVAADSKQSATSIPANGDQTKNNNDVDPFVPADDTSENTAATNSTAKKNDTTITAQKDLPATTQN